MAKLLIACACVLTVAASEVADARPHPGKPVARACPVGKVLQCRAEIVRLRKAVRWQRKRALQSWPGDAAAAILLACRVRHWSASRCDEAFRVAHCESRMNPRDRNHSSTASGLFQFLDSTWERAGIAGLSVFDPYANALAALRLVENDGGWHEWVCQP